MSAAYATCGGNQAIAFGEELHEPHRHLGGVIMMAGLIGALATRAGTEIGVIRS